MPSLLRYSILFASLTGLAACGGDSTGGNNDADASVAADSGQTQQDGGTTPTDGGATTDDGGATTDDGGTTEADAAADAAATVEPYLTTALDVRTPNTGGTTYSDLDCIVGPLPEPNYLSSGMDGDRRVLSVRCSIFFSDRPWTITFTAFNATSGFNATDTNCSGVTPQSVLSSVSIPGVGGAGSCAPDYATRVIIDSVDYDARTVSGSVDITLRSATAPTPTFNINGTFSGAWAAPTT